jgi:hypothetical protein
VVLGQVVVMGDEAEAGGGFDVWEEVINVEGLCGVEVELFNSDLKNFGAGFGGFGRVGVDAALEEVEDGKLREEEVFMKAAGVGKEEEGVGRGELLEGAGKGQVWGEDIAPDLAEFGGRVFESDGVDGLGDEGLVVDLAVFKGEFEVMEAVKQGVFGAIGSSGQAAGGNAEVEADDDVADVAEDGGGGHWGGFRDGSGWLRRSCGRHWGG